MTRRDFRSALRQPSLFGRLRHIEQALVRECELLTPYERKKVIPQLLDARELIRDADAALTALDEKRRGRANAKS